MKKFVLASALALALSACAGTREPLNTQGGGTDHPIDRDGDLHNSRPTLPRPTS